MRKQIVKLLLQLNELLDILRKGIRWLRGRKNKGPLIIMDYRGYGSHNWVWLKGRVLRDRGIITSIQDSKWRTLINNYKRFGSKEIRFANLSVSLGKEKFSIHSDKEGYFTLHTPLNIQNNLTAQKWNHAKVQIDSLKQKSEEKVFTVEYLIPPPQAQYGVISDIDDTILKTDVTSLLKLKLVYHTLFKSAARRQAISEASAFYKSLEYGNSISRVNPVFYVSNSPWNLYDLLVEFLYLNNLPKGPLLLRDFGLPYEEKPKARYGYKHQSILQIMAAYPELPFVLIGDSGEKDPYIYQAVAEEYPDRVIGIYIRDVESSRRRRKIQELITNTGVDLCLVKNYSNAAIHASERKLIDFTRFTKLL